MCILPRRAKYECVRWYYVILEKNTKAFFTLVLNPFQLHNFILTFPFLRGILPHFSKEPCRTGLTKAQSQMLDSLTGLTGFKAIFGLIRPS